MVNAELETVIADMDYPRQISEYPDRVLSYHKNTRVTIGGEIRVNWVGSRNQTVNYDQTDPFFNSDPHGRGSFGDLQLSTAKLTVDARGRRWRAYIDMNLNGYNGLQPVDRLTNPNRPGDTPTTRYRRDNREFWASEAYIELMKDGHSGLGFKAGLMELPFGLTARPDLIGQSFLDAANLTGSYLLRPMAQDGGQILPHASRFLDPAVAFMLNYEMRDIIRFEGGIFQEYDGQRYRRLGGSGYEKIRSESTVPLSYQLGFSILPLDGWELSATFRNRHSRTRGIRYWADTPYRSDFRNNLAWGNGDPHWDEGLEQWTDNGSGVGFGSRRNEQAFTVGIAVEIPNTNLSVQLEYAHGWNQGFNKYINSDNVNLGLSYRLTPRLTLHGQAEWLHVKDRSWLVESAGAWRRDDRNHRLYRFLFGAEYELVRGLTVEGGWQYEYWNYTSSRGYNGAGRTDRVLTANMVYLGTRFIF